VSYLVLARKYRPQTFEAVVGQAHVTQTLMNAIAANRVAHAILFAGPRGTGKTTVARILAKAMNCETGPTARPCNTCQSCREITADSSADVFEIDGASNNSVDQIRQLRDNIVFMPTASRYKIYIIDEVHMLSLSAFNALLKTLEEPPAHVLFFFATTEIQKIPITILSRCQRHDMRRIDHDAIVSHLALLCEKEKVDIQPDSLALIARQADGSMRDALSLLDQVMAGSDGAVAREFVLDLLGCMDRAAIADLGDALISGDIRRMLLKIEEIHVNGQDLQRVYNDLLTWLRDLMVVKVAPSPGKLITASAAEMDTLTGQAGKVSDVHLAWLFENLYRDEVTVRLSPHPRMAMEMVLIRLGEMKPVLPIDTLIEKIDGLKSAFEQAPASTHDDQASLSSPSAVTAPHRPAGPIDVSSHREMAGGPPDTPVPPADSGPDTSNGTAPCLPEIDRAVEESIDVVWEQICRQLSDTTPSLAANLTGSRVTVKGDGRVELEIGGGDFNLNRVRRKKNMTAIERLLGEKLHRTIQISIKGGRVTGDHRQSRKKKHAELEKEALMHPVVIDAIEVFNGRVEKVTLQKEEDQ